MTDQSATNDQSPADDDQIDVRNNRESKAAAANATSNVARGSDGGAPPKEAPAAGELPETHEGGAASGNPVAGVTMSQEDLENAVEPDTGPTGNEGPSVGHA